MKTRPKMQVLQQLNMMSPEISTLVFDHFSLRESDMKCLAPALCCNPHVTSVSFACNEFLGDSSVSHLCLSLISGGDSVCEVSLSKVGATSQSGKHLARLLEHNKKIDFLQLSSNKVISSRCDRAHLTFHSPSMTSWEMPG